MTDHINSLLISLGRASWRGALALLLVGILCRVFARRLPADVHCWLWRLGYGKLLLGLVLSGGVLVPLLSPAPRPLPAFSTPAASTAFPVPASQQAAAAPDHFAPPSARAVSGPVLGWQSALALAYGLGLAVCLSRLLLAALRTRRILRSAASLADGPETGCASDLARRIGLRHVPLLARSSSIASPVYVAGTILLPAEARYEEADLRMILAHELAHARRRDLFWEWLGTGVQVVFFFHPFVVLARREERLAREAAADALALQATEAHVSAYGELLLSLSLQQNQPHPQIVGAVGVIEGGSLLRRRLLALRDAAGRTNTVRTRRLAFALVPLMALVFVPWKMTHGQTLQSSGPAASASQQRSASPTPYAYLMPAGDKRIVGTVRNEQGRPLAGFTVGLTWQPPEAKPGEPILSPVQVRMVLTDAQGRFTFSGLPAGKFTYEVQSRTNYDVLPNTDSYVTVDAPLEIASTDSQKTLDIVMATGSLVSGRVVDGQTGKPVPGVFVGAGPIPSGGDLAQWTSWTMPSEATTDAEGRYQVRVMPGDVFVGVGRISNSLTSRRVRYATQRVRVKKDQMASAPDLSVFLNPMLVCMEPGGQPAASARIYLVPTETPKYNPQDDHTDDTGTVILDRIDAGIFSITQGGNHAYGTYHWSPGQPLVVTVNGQTQTYPSGVATVQLMEDSAGALTGTVVGEDEEPIADARIHVVQIRNHYGVADFNFKTDDAGIFHVTLNPDGQYNVEIRADGFNQVNLKEGGSSLINGTSADLGMTRLVHAGGFVSGRVVDKTGRPMAGVLVFVQGGKTDISANVTNDQGHFRIPNVVAGDILALNLCLQGSSPDSGQVSVQSNEEMSLPGVKASSIEREIVWNPHT